jgi:hypothetical protein
VNNVLTVLNTMLKKAVEWGVLDRMPCMVGVVPTPKPAAQFHDFDAFERLVDAARDLDWRAELIVLLGGEAGTTVRGDRGVGVERCGSGEAVALRPAA